MNNVKRAVQNFAEYMADNFLLPRTLILLFSIV